MNIFYDPTARIVEEVKGEPVNSELRALSYGDDHDNPTPCQLWRDPEGPNIHGDTVFIPVSNGGGPRLQSTPPFVYRLDYKDESVEFVEYEDPEDDDPDTFVDYASPHVLGMALKLTREALTAVLTEVTRKADGETL